MAVQSASPEYACCAVRPCRAMAATPLSSAMRPASRNVWWCSSMPIRVLIVTGTSWRAAVATVASKIIFSRSRL